METLGTVLISLGIILALAVGILITIGVIPLDSYMESYQEKRAREKRARERQLRDSLEQPRDG
jgi:hypothetical protein